MWLSGFTLTENGFPTSRKLNKTRLGKDKCEMRFSKPGYFDLRIVLAALTIGFLLASVNFGGTAEKIAAGNLSGGLNSLTRFSSTGADLETNNVDQADLQEGLQGYWRFDDPKVSRGYSMEFDGSDDYIEVSDNGNSSLDVDYLTFTAWVKTSGQSTSNMVMNKENTYEIAAGTDGISMAVQAESCSNWCNSWAIEDAGNLESGKWTFVAGTWNGSHMKVYKDGNEVATYQNTGAGAIRETDRNLGIGARDVDQSPSSYFTGVIENPQVYSRVLTKSEIQEIFQESYEENWLPSSCSDLPKSAKSGYYSIDPNGGSADDSFTVYCRIDSGEAWTKLWFTSDKENGYGFVSCESGKWEGEWSTNPLVDLDPECNQDINETIYSLDYYSSGTNQISNSQIKELEDESTKTVYSGAFHFYDADNNCDNGREPVTTYNNSGPSGNSLNVIPTLGDPSDDATHLICGGGNSGSYQVMDSNWETVMKGGVPTGLALQSGSGDTGCWNCSGYNPGYGSTVEFNQTFFWVKSPNERRDLVMSFSFDERDCKLTSSETCLTGESTYQLAGNPENFNDNKLDTGSGWIQETPLNRPILRDFSRNENQGTFFGGNSGNLRNFNLSSPNSDWREGRIGDYALEFDGGSEDDDYVKVNDIGFESDKATISWWARINTTNGRNYAFDTANNRDALLKWDNGDTTELIWRFADGTGSHYVQGDRLGEWVFYTMVADGDNEYLYVNGEKVDSRSQDHVPLKFDELYIGEYQGLGYTLNGSIDDFRIYSRDLSKSEIKSIYQGGSVTKGLVGRWNFEAGEGKKAYDTSSLSKRGVFGTGAVSFDGRNDYISIPEKDLPANNDTYALAAWFRAGSDCSCGIIGWGDWGTTNETNAFRLRNAGDNSEVSFRHYWWGNDLDATTNIGYNKWHFALAQFNGTHRSIWLNDRRVSVDSPSSYRALADGARIGDTNRGEFFDGSLDEVRIYNRSLSKEEIRRLAFQ